MAHNKDPPEVASRQTHTSEKRRKSLDDVHTEPAVCPIDQHATKERDELHQRLDVVAATQELPPGKHPIDPSKSLLPAERTFVRRFPKPSDMLGGLGKLSIVYTKHSVYKERGGDWSSTTRWGSIWRVQLGEKFCGDVCFKRENLVGIRLCVTRAA